MTRLKIALLIGNKPDFDQYAFKYFILSMNRHQKTYEFFFPYVEKYYTPANKGDTGMWISDYNEIVKNNNIRADYFIIIVQNEIEGGLFAWYDKIGAVVTTDSWQKYFSPPSLFEYLLNTIYYCLINSKKIRPGTNSVEDTTEFIVDDLHPETYGCYADEALNKYDNRISVALGYICDNHKEKIISFYGEEYYDETTKILERKWIGDLDVKNSIAYNLNHYFKFNIYRDSGFNKSFWDHIKDKFYEIPGSLLYDGLKLILLAILASILVKIGFELGK